MSPIAIDCADVVIFSPGYGASRSFYATYHEQLASKGYVVVAIEHLYDVAYVDIPGLGVFQNPYINASAENIIDEMHAVRVQDALFILRSLADPKSQLVTGVESLIANGGSGYDTDTWWSKNARVAMYGHSLGGSTSAGAMLVDNTSVTLLGGINLDGSFVGPAINSPTPPHNYLDSPFLLFGHQGHNRTSDPTWSFFYDNVLRGWKRELALLDAQHLTFSDFPPLVDLFGLRNLLPPADVDAKPVGRVEPKDQRRRVLLTDTVEIRLSKRITKPGKTCQSTAHKSKKSKADTGQETNVEPPSIRVEETPPELPREASSFRKAMSKAKNFIPRSSHSRAPSRGPSERAKSQEHLPVLDAIGKPSIDDVDRSVDIKNDLGESLKPADRQMGSVGRASEAVKAGAEDMSANLPTDSLVAKGEIDKPSLQDAIQASNRQLQVMYTIGGDVQKAAERGIQSNAALDKADTAASFLKPLKAFDSVIKGLADVHPYAKVALSVLCWASQAILAQANRDKSIQGLQSRISDVYEFMLGDGQLEKMISMKDILSQTSQVVYECAKFIQVYSQPNFLSRLGKGVFSDTDEAVAKYTKAIDDLMQQFNQYAMRNVLTATHRALEDIRQLGDNQYLDRIEYAKGAGLDTTKACLDGTRQEILGETIDWINDTDPNAPRILWLSGSAGTGKSAIAHTIARAMKDSGALGSCFCFEKGDVKRYTKLFSTVSRDLAGRDIWLKQALASVIAHDPSVATTVDVMQQWENLIREPLSATSGDTIGRLVIVIDALDESGDPRTRKHILSLLTKQVSALPNNIRILLTSRPIPDIRKAFDGTLHVKRKSMDEIPLSLTERDIQSYISNQLSDADYSFSPDEIVALAKKSDGLFEWARLACDRIMSDKAGLSEQERYKKLMLQTESGGIKLLDEMYIVILKEIMGERPEELVLNRFRSVMRHVLFTLEPLPLEALVTMHDSIQPEQDKYDAEATILRRLGSLLAGIHDQFTPIRPLHSSFYDFLIDKDRSGEFFVAEADAHLDLTLASLYVMRRELCFNICQLESSYLRNSEISDLVQRVKQYISPQLSYSCRFLGHHVDGVTFKDNVAAVLKDILCTERMLYWIETLSLHQLMNISLQCLTTIVNWLESNEGCEQMILAAKDGIQLIQNFGGMISESVPHLYLSALPFLPEDSILSKLLSMKFPLIAKVVSGQIATWPPFGCLLTGHTGMVYSVTFSHDGKWAASGSEDRTIRIWDTEIGVSVGEPLKGHTGPVTSVAFSPDSKLLVSSSKDETVCIWDTVTGSLMRDPLKGHSNWVWSVAFSPSGERFVSGSSDNTICIWDAKTGMTVGNPLKGHTGAVLCVAFSPDSQKIISGSIDKTIIIWDANTGLTVCKLLEGHTDSVWSIAFSPDGSKIVSGSNDKTICVWDVETGLETDNCLKWHGAGIYSVVVSPNGKWILSASADHTIQAWDIATGTPLIIPFKPHSDGVRSFAVSKDGKKIVSGSWDNTVYIGDVEVLQVGKLDGQHTGSPVFSVDISPDGKQIVSGSQDGTVHIWDMESGILIKGPLKGHDRRVWSVTFSPDGQKIASGSEDCTMCIWDAKDGLQLGSPYQGHASPVWSLAFSPDGQQIVSSSEDGSICFWNVNTSVQLEGSIQGHYCVVEAVAFSQNGEKLASGSDDTTVSIWDVKTRTQIGGPLTGHRDAVLSVAWSQDGDKIVSGSTDNTILIWDVWKGVQVGSPLKGHTSSVRSVVFSPDGERIVSGSWDKTIRIWNVSDGEQVGCPLKGHTAHVMSVAFSPTGELVVSGSTDGTIRVWETCHHSNIVNSISLSSSAKHSLCNAEDIFNGTPYLEENWREHVNLNDDGWIVGPQGQLLLWIPMQLRNLLHTPGTVLILPGPAVELDLSVMAHGKKWIDCFES